MICIVTGSASASRALFEPADGKPHADKGYGLMTLVPPVAGPVLGLTPVTVGAAT